MALLATTKTVGGRSFFVTKELSKKERPQCPHQCPHKSFTAHLKKIYGAPSLKAAQVEFKKFKQVWSNYPGAISVWERNFAHVEQLYQYGSSVRKIMYTTNAIESINSSFRKVTKKGAFPNENALLKLLYLRITELYKNGITAQFLIGQWYVTN